MFKERASSSTLFKACRQVLCLLGLFDRPAPTDLLRVLRDGPPIGGLTEGLTSRWFGRAVGMPGECFGLG